MGSDWYLAFKTRSGQLMYLGEVNGKVRQVGGKHLAKKHVSEKAANDYKEAMNVNAMYQAVKD